MSRKADDQRIEHQSEEVQKIMRSVGVESLAELSPHHFYVLQPDGRVECHAAPGNSYAFTYGATQDEV